MADRFSKRILRGKAMDILRRIDEQLAKVTKESQDLARIELTSFRGKSATTEELKKWKGLELCIIDTRNAGYTARDVIEELGIMTDEEIYKYIMNLRHLRREKEREQHGNTLRNR